MPTIDLENDLNGGKHVVFTLSRVFTHDEEK